MNTAIDSQEMNIKTEPLDEWENFTDIKYEPIEIIGTIKDEQQKYSVENMLESDEFVTYEKLPWKIEPVDIESTSRRSRTRSFEYDSNLMLKSEIDAEEASLENHQNQTNQRNKKQKNKQSEVNRRKATNLKPEQNKSKQDRNQCKLCSKCFVSQKSLRYHSRQHSSELPYECKLCAMRFKKITQKKRHESNCTERRFECYVCRLSCLHWRWNRLIDHFRQHTGDKPFKCNCCSQAFSSKRKLGHHMKYHPNEILLKCSFCERGFSTSDEAKHHESKCALKRQMECYLCKSVFTHKSSLLRHMPQHTGLNKFKCMYCEKAFARKDFFTEHIKTHTQELQFYCKKCKQRFPNKTDLDAHKLICAQKLFKCDLCNYSTISKTYAADHKQQHIGTDEFKCWHCPKVFLQRSKLVHHVKTHNKKMPFYCPFCQKSYQRWLLMEKHRQACQRQHTAHSKQR